ncbi:MAG: hypothetical protein JWO95_3104 [Verrucomicrobiales bacterium]|nr:hypothetical protein [Verrucomicrobiales bacterium]
MPIVTSNRRAARRKPFQSKVVVLFISAASVNAEAAFLPEPVIARLQETPIAQDNSVRFLDTKKGKSQS